MQTEKGGFNRLREGLKAQKQIIKSLRFTRCKGLAGASIY